MRVLHIINNLEDPAGAEQMLARLVNRTPDHHHLVVSLLGAHSNVLELLKGDNFEVRTLGCGRSGSAALSALPRLHRVLRGRKFDVVQGWLYVANLVACLYARLTGSRVPLWLGVHHSLEAFEQESRATRFSIHALRFLLPVATGLIFCAERSRDQHLAFGWRHPRCEVVPNGFLFPPPPARPSSEHMALGAAGRFHPAKDYPTLFEAVGPLLNRRSNLRLRLAGTELTADNPEVLALIREHRLPREQVDLLGLVSPEAMSEFYGSLDAFVLSSRNEGLPSVLIEAMAASLPCVSTDVGDAALVLDRPERIVPPRNPEQLSNALEVLMSLSSREREREGALNRERVLAHYSMAAASDRYVKLWRSSLAP
tara:strand:- start:1960 stop:3066 length:1107 start_codon:yes stop_codon:yes gene_type:complete